MSVIDDNLKQDNEFTFAPFNIPENFLNYNCPVAFGLNGGLSIIDNH